MTYSQANSGTNEAYNDTTIMMEETNIGGFHSQQGLVDDGMGRIPSAGMRVRSQVLTVQIMPPPS